MPCAYDPTALAEALGAAGHSVTIAPAPRAGLLGAWSATLRTARAHARHDRSIVCEHVGAAVGAWWARWYSRRPYALLVTTTTVPRFRRWPVWPWIVCSVYKRACGVAVFNGEVRDTLIRFGVRRQVLTLCGPPCDVREALPGPGDVPKVFAMTSPTSPYSNAALLRVLGHLLEKVPQAQMLVVAPGGDSALESRCDAMGLGANFRLVESMPESPQGVALIYVSRGEQPQVPFAAMAMGAGLPLAATRHALLADWLRDEETALLSAPSDEAAAADAIARLLLEPALALRMASAAHARASTRHGWAALLEVLLKP